MKIEKLLYIGLPVLTLVLYIAIAADFLASGLTIANILISILFFIIGIVVFIFLIRGSFGILKGLKAQKEKTDIMIPLTSQEEIRIDELSKLRTDIFWHPDCDLSEDEKQAIDDEYFSLIKRKHYFKTDHYDYRKKFAEIMEEKE